MSDLEELFSEGDGAPAPRSGLILGLLGTGLVTAVIGMACTAAPGGILVLLAWMLVEKEMDRIDAGYLAADARPHVQRLRLLAYGAVVSIIVLFLVQGVLFYQGFYEVLWTSLLALVAA